MSTCDGQYGRTIVDKSALTRGRREADEENLRVALRGLRESAGGARSVNAQLSEVAQLAARAIPGVDGVGVAAFDVSEGNLRVRAWEITAPFVRELDILQYVVLDQGPCISCTIARRPIVSMALGTDTRWRRLAARVAGLGVESALSLPLLIDDKVIGLINCYAHGRAAFGHHAVRLGMRFAKPAAISLENARLKRVAQDRAAQLQHLMEARSVIYQAVGVVRGRTGGSDQDTLAYLRQISERENFELRAIAQRIVRQAARHSQDRCNNPS